MGIRAWVEQAPATNSLLVGIILGTLTYFLPLGLEMTIMLAMVMPGIYWGFAFVYDGMTELPQETVIMIGLAYFNYGYCLQNLPDNPYCAPLAVFVHGMVDFWHHFRLPPLLSSDHVKSCCEHYPVICGCLDFAFAGTMSLLILVFGR